MHMSEPITREVGMKAPPFAVLDSNGDNHKSEEYIEKGRSVIVYFYPRDSTPGCTKQACDFRDNMARLKSEGYEVLGVSKDSEKSH